MHNKLVVSTTIMSAPRHPESCNEVVESENILFIKQIDRVEEDLGNDVEV